MDSQDSTAAGQSRSIFPLRSRTNHVRGIVLRASPSPDGLTRTLGIKAAGQTRREDSSLAKGLMRKRAHTSVRQQQAWLAIGGYGSGSDSSAVDSDSEGGGERVKKPTRKRHITAIVRKPTRIRIPARSASNTRSLSPVESRSSAPALPSVFPSCSSPLSRSRSLLHSEVPVRVRSRSPSPASRSRQFQPQQLTTLALGPSHTQGDSPVMTRSTMPRRPALDASSATPSPSTSPFSRSRRLIPDNSLSLVTHPRQVQSQAAGTMAVHSSPVAESLRNTYSISPLSSPTLSPTICNNNPSSRSPHLQSRTLVLGGSRFPSQTNSVSVATRASDSTLVADAAAGGPGSIDGVDWVRQAREVAHKLTVAHQVGPGLPFRGLARCSTPPVFATYQQVRALEMPADLQVEDLDSDRESDILERRAQLCLGS